ncbi:MAG TPA: hypothetical protein VGN42_22680 [Pirellulales bacterium]|jgi:hypothetical protein|nr:hypothetical protein [Pirellulales bacterium]
MSKLFSLLVVAGVTTAAGIDSVRACGCGGAAAAPAPAAAAVPRAPTTTAQNGRQSTRRYSSMPSTYAAPMMRSYRSNGSRGPSWSASRKILGY